MEEVVSSLVLSSGALAAREARCQSGKRQKAKGRRQGSEVRNHAVGVTHNTALDGSRRARPPCLAQEVIIHALHPAAVSCRYGQTP